MKNVLKYITLILLTISITSCTLYKDVEMKGVQDFKIGELKSGKTDVTVKVKINNPNKYKIKVKKSILDLFIDGKSIGEAVMKNDIIIAKKAEQIYDFVIQVDYNEIKKQAGTLLTSALFKKTIKVQAKGKVKVVVRSIFSKKIDVNEEKEINIQELMGNF